MQFSRSGSLNQVLVLAAAGMLGLLLPASVTAAGDPLWEKAVSLAERMESDGVTFGTMEIRSLVKKKDGSIETELRMAYRTVLEGDDIGAEVVSATENGKDITEKIREEEKNHREKKDKKADGEEAGISIGPGDHPFESDGQGAIVYHRLGPAELEGRETILFRFTQKPNNKGEGAIGHAWLDPQTGAPIQVETRPDPLPKMVDEMVTRTRFEVTEEGYWVPESGEMNGSGGLLWIKRWMEMRFTFSDYRLKGTLPSAKDPAS